MKRKLIIILFDFIKRIREDDLSAWASKLAFYILLSIFPLLIFIMELLRHIDFENPEVVYTITEFFPKEIIDFFEYIILDISNVKTPSSVVPITIIATVWAASKGIMAIISGLNMAYREKETRSYFYLRSLSFIYTVAFAFILLITLALVVFGNKILAFLVSYMPFLLDFENFIDIIRYVFSILITLMFFVLLYNVSPNRKISFKDVMPGSSFATIAWILVSFAFSIYVNNASSFSYMYGSLTSIILLMIWLHLTSVIIMLGGELNAVISDYNNE